MLFPKFRYKSKAEINLNREAERWLAEQSSSTSNSLLDPVVCQAFVADYHRRLGVDFSYGGWMEDRSTLWRGSYLDTDQRYIHLGVDFNVPAGTQVAVERLSNVIRIDNDYPDRYGWGTRVIVQEPDSNVVLLFAHLDQNIDIHVGETLKTGLTFAKVGVPPYNGDWFPHLHVQVINLEHYTQLLKNDLRDLDGYGHAINIELLKQRFPNPTLYVSP